MMKFVFAALAFTAIIWGTTAVALRQSHQEQVTMEENRPRPAGRHGNRGGTRLVGHPCPPPHVVIASRCRSAGHRLGELEAAI